jgi:hypothetical protein
LDGLLNRLIARTHLRRLSGRHGWFLFRLLRFSRHGQLSCER